jgi:hypothetical protein
VYHIQAVDVPLYASKLRSDDVSSEALNKLHLYLHDARYTKDIYAHADVNSPLHSLYNAYIHTSCLEGIASNLQNSSDSHSAFLSSQVTLVQKAVAEHLSAMHQLGMTEFIADLDLFLAEIIVYSTPLTIPSSLPSLSHLPLHGCIPAEIKAVSPQAILPFPVKIPFVPSPPPPESPLGSEEIKAAVEAIEAVHNSVSVTSDDDEHLEGIDPTYQSPPPSPSITLTPSASSLPPTAREVAILNSVEAGLDRELDLPVD